MSSHLIHSGQCIRSGQCSVESVAAFSVTLVQLLQLGYHFKCTMICYKHFDLSSVHVLVELGTCKTNCEHFFLYL